MITFTFEFKLLVPFSVVWHNINVVVSHRCMTSGMAPELCFITNLLINA